MKLHVFLLESTKEYDTEYTYLASGDPEKTDCPFTRGTFVSVPFGPRNTPREAVVWRISESGAAEEKPRYRLKEILGLTGDLPLDERELSLCMQLRDFYRCTLGDAVRCVRPYRGSKSAPGGMVRFAVLNCTRAEFEADLEAGKFRNIHQIRFLQLLEELGGAYPAEALASTVGCSSSVCTTLEKKGYLRTEKRKIDRNAEKSLLPSLEEQLPTYEAHRLNEEQRRAFDAVSAALEAGKPEVFLLHGVTGSGKTELYLQWIARVLQKQGTAMMLVPEISLTPQMLSLFTARFGKGIAVLHSRLTAVQRVREWQRVASGEARVVIGARSAVFAPFARIDLIILDEAHDASYQAEEHGLKYHAGVVAEMRTRTHGVVVYGSATPELTLVYRARQGKIRYLSLPDRVGNAPMPEVLIADLRDEHYLMNSGRIFSSLLLEKMRENYSRGFQTMLFVGRRGYAPGLLCRECGKTMKCSKCNVAMTYHASSGRLICHYCGNTVTAPERCPACQSPYLEARGIGTERVEQELRRLFPDAGVLRMDADTTARKDGHAAILRAFSQGKAQFLVGTQMITKGHDFPHVTLVGVLNTDALLNMPEYRSQERAFQLLTQVSGRAGRGNEPGTVVIQAYDVDNYAVTAAKHQDYEEFYRNEIVIRRNLWYPPYCTVCRLLLVCEEDREGFLYFQVAARELKRLAAEMPARGEIRVYGPSRADVPKVNGRYRWLIHIKAAERQDAADLAERWLCGRKPGSKMHVSWTFETEETI